jgi:hypothetical protein
MLCEGRDLHLVNAAVASLTDDYDLDMSRHHRSNKEYKMCQPHQYLIPTTLWSQDNAQ